MNNNTEIINISLDKTKLRDFILGENDFHADNFTNDYNRWQVLKDYYLSLESLSSEKQIIKETIFELLNDTSVFSKHVAVILGRLLEIEGFSDLIMQLIYRGEARSFPDNLQKEIYISAKRVANSESMKEILVYYLERRNLIGFLLPDSFDPDMPSNSQIRDLERVDCFAKYYENSSKENQEEIQFQIKETMKASFQISSLLKLYARDHEHTSFSSFINTLN